MGWLKACWQAEEGGGGLEDQVQQDADGAQPGQGPVQVHGDQGEPP